jgi:hypothetical protein
MDDEGPTVRERHQLGGEKSSAEDSDVEVSFYILLSSVRLNKSSSWVATVGSEIIPTICHTGENKKLSRLHLTFFDTQVNSQSAIFYKDWFAAPGEGQSNEGSDAELSNNQNDSNESEGCSTERICLLDNAWGETTVDPGTWIWRCVVCRVPNDPFMRYCASCWKVS